MKYDIHDIIETLGEEESLNAIIKYLGTDTIDEMVKFFIRIYDLDFEEE